MKGKTERQKLIRDVIRNGRVANQEELAAALEASGLSVAQATLSRDIKELHISKLHDEQGYFYSLDRPLSPSRSNSGGQNTAESVTSIEFSGPLAVIKTLPGHANMVAAIIDSGDIGQIAGTIAGDDTLILVIREGFSKEDILGSLGKIFKGIEKKKI